MTIALRRSARRPARIAALSAILWLCASAEWAGAVTIPVTTTADSGGGSLRAALAAASNGDVIDLSGVAGTIALTTGVLKVQDSVDIQGPGASVLTINGGSLSGVFWVSSGSTITVKISGLTIANGNAALNDPFLQGFGGGVSNDSHTVTIADCVFTGNHAGFGGGAIANFEGNLVVERCAFRQNKADQIGGAILSDAILHSAAVTDISESEISGNEAPFGGGVHQNVQDFSTGTTTITNCTISGNKAVMPGQQGGGLMNFTANGGDATLTVRNSTIAENMAVQGAAIFDIGGNPPAGGNSKVVLGHTLIVGTMIASQADIVSEGHNISSTGLGPNDGSTDLLNTNPNLAALASNGGPTLTQAIMCSSAAYNGGAASGGPPFDQRGTGFARIVGAHMDVGAFELQTSCCGNAQLDRDELCDGSIFAGPPFPTCESEGFAGGGTLGCSSSCALDTSMCVAPETTTTSTTTTTTTSTTTTTLLDHFQCYEVKPKAFTAIPGVSVQDQFGNHTETVRFPHRLCAPADKRDEFPDAPTHPEHLIGHLVSGPSVRVPNQTLVNQFGTIELDVVKPDILMVPTLKTLAPPGPPALGQPTVDHFQCYKVKRSKGAPKFQKILGVKVDDQFGTAQLDLLKPTRLCAPANKRNEDPTAPDHPEHLLCYKTKNSGFGMVQTFTNSQFGPAQPLLIHRRELCVPSLKNPSSTTTTSTLASPTTTSSTTTSTTTSSTTTTTIYGSPSRAFLVKPIDLLD